MWLFTSRLPAHFWIVSPRGLYASPEGGYSWLESPGPDWPSLDAFEPALEELKDWLSADHFPGADLSRFYLAGFSQGAALAFAFAFRFPSRVKALAGLSGFVPGVTADLIARQPLLGKHIFIAHGSKDHLVPVALARQGVTTLQKAGAKVSYCEDEVGHKLSVGCFAGFQSFFKALEF
jgi:phospholipase/carboxylesterase